MSSDLILDRLLGLHPKKIDLSLGRLTRLLQALGNPQERLPPVVHVAGTNGKGSVVAGLRAIAEAAGLRTQVYTSPHLIRFHERIRLSTGLVDEDALAQLLTECEQANAGQPITFFEITTAAALLAFSRNPADICLLEVGLGGRFDATNVMDRPLLCVITPVSLDHQEFLGDTLALIAGEKAGILKKQVPAVIAPQQPEAQQVIQKIAAAIGAPLTWVDASAEHGTNLAGPHQRSNAAVTAAAATFLRPLGVTDKHVEQGLMQVQWPARLQLIKTGTLKNLLPARCALWVDGGHNPAAAQAIAPFYAGSKVHVIMGMLKNKNAAEYLSELAPVIGHLTAVPVQGEDCHTPQAIAEMAKELGLPASTADDLRQAIHQVPSDAEQVLVAGSLYLAGDCLRQSGVEII